MQGPSSTVHYPNPASTPGSGSNPTNTSGSANTLDQPSGGRLPERSVDRSRTESGDQSAYAATRAADQRASDEHHDSGERLRRSWDDMKTNVGSLLEKSDEQTRRRMREMLDNVDTQIGHMNRSMQSAAQRSRDQMREFSEQSRRRMQLAARRSRDQARRSARDIDRFAHDNTWAVVSAAAVGGAILGALLTSRLGSDHRSQYGSWRHDEHDWSDDDLD